MLQPIPVPVGSGSLSVADKAIPAVPAPVLLNVRVYPIEEPADTVAASGVSVRFSAGHRTDVVADACTEPLFPALNVAVFV